MHSAVSAPDIRHSKETGIVSVIGKFNFIVFDGRYQLVSAERGKYCPSPCGLYCFSHRSAVMISFNNMIRDDFAEYGCVFRLQ